MASTEGSNLTQIENGSDSTSAANGTFVDSLNESLTKLNIDCSEVEEGKFTTDQDKKATDHETSITDEKPKTGKEKLQSWLNKSMKIEMSDGRILIGNFLCTDRDANVILGACTEFLNPEVCGFSDEHRILGLVMVPGRHIVSIYLEVSTQNSENKPASN